MQINGYSYVGTLELVRSQNAWLAVDEVILENYVAPFSVQKCRVLGMVKRLKPKQWQPVLMPLRIWLALQA